MPLRVLTKIALPFSFAALGGFVFANATACSNSEKGSPAAVDASVDSGGVDLDAGVDAAVADSGACPRPASFGSTKCNACISRVCCSELAACATDATCKPLSECYLGCIVETDAGGCTRDCATKFDDKSGLWDALKTCAYFKDPCALECSVTVVGN